MPPNGFPNPALLLGHGLKMFDEGGKRQDGERQASVTSREGTVCVLGDQKVPALGIGVAERPQPGEIRFVHRPFALEGDGVAAARCQHKIDFVAVFVPPVPHRSCLEAAL